MNNDLNVWTIYDHPADFPDGYIARLFITRRGDVFATNQHFEADTLDALRAKLPPGLYRMPRDARDDPVIVETWI